MVGGVVMLLLVMMEMFVNNDDDGADGINDGDGDQRDDGGSPVTASILPEIKERTCCPSTWDWGSSWNQQGMRRRAQNTRT